MDFPTYNSAKQHLLAAASLVSPNGKIQQGFTTLVLAKEAQGTDYDTILCFIAQAINDGLTHDYWPSR